MELIFNNQLSILIDILPFYLTPKQYTKLYTSNLILYNIFIDNNKFENYYFTPKTNRELYIAITQWYYNKTIIYGNIEYWNTIYITNMNQLFCGKLNFNDDISDWNTSNVTDMAYMFWKAENFNQDISNWNTNNVISMKSMFHYADNFNQNLNKWNLNNLKYINSIFNKNFNRLNCKYWNLNNILDNDKRYMFNN